MEFWEINKYNTIQYNTITQQNTAQRNSRNISVELRTE